MVLIGCRAGLAPAGSESISEPEAAPPTAAEAPTSVRTAELSTEAAETGALIRVGTSPEPESVLAAAGVRPDGPRLPATHEEVPAAPVSVAPAPLAPDEPATPWSGQDGPVHVLIIGDSMAATDFGRELGRWLKTESNVVIRRRGKSSSGLARPDFFDWFEEGKRLVKLHDPDLVVVIIGGNDGQDLRPKTEGRWVHWRSDAWPSAYQERLNRFLDAMAARDRRFAWLRLPAMEHRRLEGKLELIRAVQSDVVVGRSDVLEEVVVTDCFYGPAGRMYRFVPEGPDAGQRLRLDDGIHFTRAGARHFAGCVGPELVRFLPAAGAAS